MYIDSQGHFITTSNKETIKFIDEFNNKILSYGKTPETVLEGLKLDPDCVILNTSVAILYLFTERPDFKPIAATYLASARTQLHRVTERERLYFFAIDAWAREETSLSAKILMELLEKYPTDIVSAKICQYHHFNLNNGLAIVDMAKLIEKANKNQAYFYGILGFGYERSKNYLEALRYGKHAISLCRNDPWAQHVVAHALEALGKVEESIEWMLNYCDTWTSFNYFMYSHNWWHIAYNYIKIGRTDAAFKIYQDYIAEDWEEYSKLINGPVSLLWYCPKGDYEWPGAKRYSKKALYVG
ncbi:MAG: hypothetical protein K0R66_1182 [Gammaproteobacteria bacterium]|nr:hypothetical protein [Gammaproteobacteria bacterium]